MLSGYVYNPREARLRKALRDLGLEPQGIISLLEARDSIWHLDENGEEEPLTPKARQRDVMDRLLASVGVQMSPSAVKVRLSYFLRSVIQFLIWRSLPAKKIY